VTAPLLATSTTRSEYRGVETPTRIAGLTDVASIAAAGSSAYAVLRDGTVRSWGGANIGDGRVPSEHGGPPGTAVFAAGNNSFAVRADGALWAWGAGGPGEFPLTSNVRVPAAAPSGLR
jgi:hypothetical protein